MAAATPFHPFASVEPGSAPTPRQSIETSPDMFGGAIARAETKLGGDIQHGASELFTAEMAKQSLYNEINASETNTWLANQVTDKWSKFGSLQGKAALEGLPQFKTDLDELYKQTIDNAPNLQQKAMLAKSGRYLTDNFYRYGTSHANRESRAWQDKVSTDSALTYGNMAALAVNEPADMEAYLRKSDDEISKRYEAQMWPREAIDAEVAKNRGRNLKNIIEVKANDDPIAASQLFRKYQTGMDAGSQLLVKNYLRAKLLPVQARDEVDRILGPEGPPSQEVGAVAPGFISHIKRFEGFTPTAKWDFKQHSIGFGTKANSPDEVITREEADKRFGTEFDKATKFVDSVNPNLDPGTRAALASLTYNSGTTWATSGLGERVRAGDLKGAKEIFLQYNKAGGETNDTLVRRRLEEASWFGQTNIPASPLPDKAAAYDKASQVAATRPELLQHMITDINRRYLRQDVMRANDNAVFDQKQNDALSESLRTGSVQTPLSEVDFIARFGLDQGTKAYKEHRAQVQLNSDIFQSNTLPPEKQLELLRSYEPKPGDGYTAAATRYDSLQKAINEVDKNRNLDPAGSVDQSDVVKAARATVKPDTPNGSQIIIDARMQAQEQIGIPEDARSPITRAEALRLTTPLNSMLPGTEREILTEMGEQFKKMFGDKADKAFAYALRIHKVDKETAVMAARVTKKLGLGIVPDPSDMTNLDNAAELTGASKIIRETDFSMDGPDNTGPAPTPPEPGVNIPSKAIITLRANPNLAPDFDKKYGPGSSAKILKSYPVR